MDASYLYHGSDHIIKRPSLGKGTLRNDYGPGFYCTEDPEMAKEWACKHNTDGFANGYSFDSRGLKVLNLLDGNHSILNWIALLLAHRTFRLSSEIAINAKAYILEHFYVDISAYDVVTGYRADDSYFSFAEGFVSNTLPLRGLNTALRLGNLGAQTVLVSEKAFDSIAFTGAEVADKTTYYPQFIARDHKARETYWTELKGSRSYHDDIFVLDIIREEMKNDDARIQRILLG